MDTCRIAIVDDHRTFAEALARALATESDIEVVGTSANRCEAEHMVEEFGPTVVLIDHRLGQESGLDLAKEFSEGRPEMRLLMLTATLDEEVAFAALEAGCIGYLSKDVPIEQVVQAVRSAANGQAVIDPSILTRMLPRMAAPTDTNPNRLTPKELEVLEHLGNGDSNTDIAAEMFVSVNTVRNHIQNILTKLGAHSRLEAVARALDDGLIRRDRSR